MYLPEVKIRKINPEQNVKFIINYLSKEKNMNSTRPFFNKTIGLFPELKNIDSIENYKERENVIRQAVLAKLQENDAIITSRIGYFEKVFQSFIYKNIEAQCKVFNYKWSESYPEINCYVGYLPFYPRSAEEKCFYVSFHDEERVFSGAVHEINHMIFWEKWKELHGDNDSEPTWPDPIWYLQEIIVDPILNDEKVKKYTLYENRAYPQFYEKGKDGLSIIDKINSAYILYKNDIDSFLNNAYEIVLSEYSLKC